MTKVPTVHNPTNFDPADYIVEDYFDNKRPRWYFGLNHIANKFAEMVAAWEAGLEGVFGSNWREKVGHCCHCGNARVRWITAARHIPTGEIVVFGSDCTERLGFENKVAFKLAILQKRAAAADRSFRLWNKKMKFLADNPALNAAYESYMFNPMHTNNSFVRNVLVSLDQYGNLSQRQMDAVIASLATDRVRLMAALAAQAAAAAAPVVEEIKGDAPEGRVEVTGIVLTVRGEDSPWGFVHKTLLKLPNNSKVWMTLPRAAVDDVKRGDSLRIVATFKRKDEDKSFAYGSRPSLVEHKAAQ